MLTKLKQVTLNHDLMSLFYTVYINIWFQLYIMTDISLVNVHYSDDHVEPGPAEGFFPLKLEFFLISVLLKGFLPVGEFSRATA